MKTKQKNGFCEDGLLERPRYFPRQLMTPDDLTLEQNFFRDKMRRHNRLLHGWGVICGALVRQKKDKDGEWVPWTVEVSPGAVLDPLGNEIVIPKTIAYNLRRESASGHAKNGDDPWCADVPVDRPLNGPLYLAICYDECQVRPVRVMPAGCGCDDSDCENSRIRESFTLQVLDELPSSYEGLDFTPGTPDIDLCACIDACPDCPPDPCVVLADITTSEDGVLLIDCYAHRRFVISFACHPVFCAADEREREVREAEEMRERLATHIDESGMRALMEAHGGAVGAATALPLPALSGLGARSDAGVALQGMTIGEAAGLTYEEFVARADPLLADLDPGKRQYFERQSEMIWLRAREVERLTRRYRMA